MNQENPNSLPEEIQKMVDEREHAFNEKIDGIVRESNDADNRYAQALRVFQEAAGGDQAVLSHLGAAVRAEVMRLPYEHEQRIMDAARFLAVQFEEETKKGAEMKLQDMAALCSRAFEALLQEPHNYFKASE